MSDAGADDFADDISDNDVGEFFDEDEDVEDPDSDDDQKESDEDDEEDDEYKWMDMTDSKSGIDSRNMKLTKMRSGSESRRIPNIQRKTRSVMDRYEFAKCLSMRTQQIANGQEPLFIPPKEMTASDQIAYHEIMQKKTPYILVRKVPHATLGEVEEWWKLSELTIPQNDY